MIRGAISHADGLAYRVDGGEVVLIFNASEVGYREALTVLLDIKQRYGYTEFDEIIGLLTAGVVKGGVN